MTDRDPRQPRADSGQEQLIDAGDVQRRPRRVERAIAAAVEAAGIDNVDKGAAALAVELGRAVDVASGRNDPYGVAAAARELREQLIRLRLDPTARDNDDADSAALRELFGGEPHVSPG